MEGKTTEATLAILILLVTSIATPQSLQQKHGVNHRPLKPAAMIWSGKSAGMLVRWSKSDIIVQEGNDSRPVLSPLVKRGFAAFSAATLDGVDKNDPTANCDYERTFALLSVVGSIMSFDDGYYADCNGAHPSTYSRITAVDLAKPASILYTDDPGNDVQATDLKHPNKIVKLTDYFPEAGVLKALIDNKTIQPLLKERPNSIASLISMVQQSGMEIKDCPYDLPQDFLTRFAFDHLVESNVVVKVSLPASGQACDAAELELLLEVPESLRRPLDLASKGQEGFLVKNHAPGETKFSRKLGKGANR